MQLSRDFILILSGGLVSLVTTLVILFVMDYFYRRDQARQQQRSVSANPRAGSGQSEPTNEARQEATILLPRVEVVTKPSKPARQEQPRVRAKPAAAAQSEPSKSARQEQPRVPAKPVTAVESEPGEPAREEPRVASPPVEVSKLEPSEPPQPQQPSAPSPTVEVLSKSAPGEPTRPSEPGLPPPETMESRKT